VTRADGQALVEFALVLPLLLVFAFATLFIAQIGVARLALEHAAAEGARAGALTDLDSEIKGAIEAGVSPLDARQVRVTIEPPQGVAPRDHDPRGSLLRVGLEYTVPVPLAFLGLPGVTVTARAARLIEWTP
jgi:hypothetical protein